MDFDLSFVASPYSTLLAMASFLGFIWVARKELISWIGGRVTAVRAATRAAYAPACGRITLLAGLILLGIGLSDVVFVLYHRAELANIANAFLYFSLYFFLVMVPGSLAGLLASFWLDASSSIRRGGLLERSLYGIIFFLALLTVIEFTGYDWLLLAFGPLVMLLIYALSPPETAQ